MNGKNLEEPDNLQDETTSKSGFVKHSGDGSSFTVLHAFKCAREGIAHAFSTQRNFKIHLAFALLAILLAIFLQVSESAWFAIIICITIVFALEMMNTAIESVVDMVSPEWHQLAKVAKDCGAGAVYIAAVGSLVVAAFSYVPPIIRLISSFVQ